MKLVALGDSLTAGYNLPAAAAFPAVLEAALKARGHDGRDRECRRLGRHRERRARPARLVGAGRHGRRHPRTRRQRHAARHRSRRHPDGARRRSCARLAERRIPVLLAGMKASPQSRAGLTSSASTRSIPTSPANTGSSSTRSSWTASPGEPRLTLPDGLHPSAEGVRMMVERILPTSRLPGAPQGLSPDGEPGVNRDDLRPCGRGARPRAWHPAREGTRCHACSRASRSRPPSRTRSRPSAAGSSARAGSTRPTTT